MAIIARTKTELIYSDLKNKILTCELPPDTRLIIRKLAEEYGSSDIPVREALKELTAEGLVETIPHIGSRVVGISVQNIKDMLEMREYLEPLAAKLAAQNATKEDVEHLQDVYTRAEAIADTGDMKAYSVANREFHRVINHAAGNVYLENFLENLIDIDKRTCMIFQTYGNTVHYSRTEHKEMIKLMDAHDADGLEKLMRSHKQRAIKKMKNYFKIK